MMFSKPKCKMCGDYLYEKHKAKTAIGQYYGETVQYPIGICNSCHNTVCYYCVGRGHISINFNESDCPVCGAKRTIKFFDDHKGKIATII